MKKVVVIVLSSIILVALTGCTDVLRKYSEKSLDQIVTSFDNILKEDNEKYILSVDGTNSLIVKKDYSDSKEDIVMELDATSFIKAGMSETNIPSGYRLENNKIIIPTDFGNGKESGFIKSFFLAVDNQRESLSYHQDLDHYGISLHGENKFEFAKDCKTNDKDIVFVLAVNPLEALGIDVNNIDGWVLKTIEQPDKIKVDVIVKPYDMEMNN